MVIRIKENVRWHLSVRITVKCYVVFLEPSFEPFLNDVADNILLFYNDVDIAEIETNLPLHGFYFVNIKKSVVNFFCCKFGRELIIH